MYNNSIYIIFILFIFGCTNSNENGITDPTLFHDKYQGITFTDIEGNVIQEDKRDWNLVFNSSPYGLYFDQDSTFDITSNPILIQYNINPIYPNPCYGFCTLEFSLARNSNVEISLLDYKENVDVIMSRMMLNAGTYQLAFKKPLTKGIYRCIYKIDNYYGYGDIWFK